MKKILQKVQGGNIRSFLKEPIVHFLFTGLLLFIIASFFDDEELNNEYVIEIKRGDVESMINRWFLQMKRLPNKKELNTFLDNLVREEILYREAKAMGLDNNDVIVKRRLVQKFEFLTNDLLDPPNPSVTELDKYFNENKKKYLDNEKVSFTHIFYNPEKRNEATLFSEMGRDKNELNRSKTIPKKFYEMGDAFLLPNKFNNFSKVETIDKFGTEEFSSKIFELETGKWSGPLLSSYGYHLVYVTKKENLSEPTLESIEEKLQSDYLEE